MPARSGTAAPARRAPVAKPWRPRRTRPTLKRCAGGSRRWSVRCGVRRETSWVQATAGRVDLFSAAVELPEFATLHVVGESSHMTSVPLNLDTLALPGGHRSSEGFALLPCEREHMQPCLPNGATASDVHRSEAIGDSQPYAANLRLLPTQARTCVAAVWRAALTFAVIVGTMGTARAYDCYLVPQNTKLYAESMLQTPTATISADVIGWFGLRRLNEPGIWLRFPEIDGDRLVSELDAYVNPTEVRPVACPAIQWSRPTNLLMKLTWPDGRSAGTMLPEVIELRRSGIKEREGRVCFHLGTAAISADVCAAAGEPAQQGCIGLPRSTQLFALPRANARMGKTTAAIYARNSFRVDKFYRATLFDLNGQEFDAYFLRAGVSSVECPEIPTQTGMESIPPYEALLPNGISAGLRIGNELSLAPTRKVRVGGHVLLCRDEHILAGVSLKLCHRDTTSTRK